MVVFYLGPCRCHKALSMPQDSAGHEMKVGMRPSISRIFKDALIKCTETGEDCPNSGDVDQRTAPER